MDSLPKAGSVWPGEAVAAEGGHEPPLASRAAYKYVVVLKGRVCGLHSAGELGSGADGLASTAAVLQDRPALLWGPILPLRSSLKQIIFRRGSKPRGLPKQGYFQYFTGYL